MTKRDASDASGAAQADGFKDHFSGGSDDYRRWRPRYPDALFDWLASESPSRRLAWDCATGSGQAAVALARCFDRVVASDASAAQIREAEACEGVEYTVAPAEQAPFGDGEVDLVTVAQALHWFDIERFHAQVRRVLRPGGLLAEWTYQHASIDPDIDVPVIQYAAGTVGPYWPPERRLVDSGYSDVPFPFEALEPPPFAMTATWSLDRYLGYLGTWSATTRYRETTGTDPLPALRDELAPLWGDAEREVRWPLLLRVGRA